MFMSRGEAERNSPSLRTGSLSPQQQLRCVTPSLLETKDVGIMKSQTSHQLFKVTQAPRWT